MQSVACKSSKWKNALLKQMQELVSCLRMRPATEDRNKWTVRSFTPAAVDCDNDPWNMLHRAGVTNCFMIFPNATNDGGTFQWTNDLGAAKRGARSCCCPQTKGIDLGCVEAQCFSFAKMFDKSSPSTLMANHMPWNALWVTLETCRASWRRVKLTQERIPEIIWVALCDIGKSRLQG
jgi:hypothetical protein